MKNPFLFAGISGLVALLGACGGSGSGTTPASTGNTSAAANVVLAPAYEHANPAGLMETWAPNGRIDTNHPFFRPIGNGRSCASCHSPSDGWSLTPASIRARFDSTEGNDPLFMPHDAANSPLAPTGTLAARETAYSMLLDKGLIRIGLPVPATAEFELANAQDPYGFSSSAELSLFRRPLPAANLRFVTSVMWDGRETPVVPQSSLCVQLTGLCFASTRTSLTTQALTASRGHHQLAGTLAQSDLDAIVKLESNLFVAQKSSATAGDLTGAGNGGAGGLSLSEFWFGINNFDSGDYRTGAPFTTRVFTTFDAWNSTGSVADAGLPPAEAAAQDAARKSIARGQAIFNGRPIFINSVPGMRAASVRGSCASCHDTPAAGSSSTPLLVNIGTADGARRSADMPLFTLRNKQSGELIQVTDPGAALTSGRWSDIGKFKVPVLRGLAARPPYFHDGSAAGLRDVVQFYNDRFQMSLTRQDMDDLVAFLSAL